MKSTICIIDDDSAVRESLRLVLELNGYGVEEFGEGAHFLARQHFDDLFCVVLDLNLPGDNGLQILSQLRDRAVTAPAVIVTGRADASARREAKRLAAHAFFEKPVPARDLLTAIEAIGNLSPNP